MCSFLTLLNEKDCHLEQNILRYSLSYSKCSKVLFTRVNNISCSHFGDTNTAIGDLAMLRPLNNFMLSSTVIKLGRMLSEGLCSTLHYIVWFTDVYYKLCIILCTLYTIAIYFTLSIIHQIP